MKKRKNRGITLIALVITIIVLLILAGITLNLVLGERGIFKMAEEGKESYQMEAAKEKVSILLLDYIATKYESGEELDEYLNRKQQEGELDEVISNGDATHTVITNGYEIIVDDEKLEIIEITEESWFMHLTRGKAKFVYTIESEYVADVDVVIQSDESVKMYNIQYKIGDEEDANWIDYEEGTTFKVKVNGTIYGRIINRDTEEIGYEFKSEINEIDTTLPQEAIITFNTPAVNAGGTIQATVKLEDLESGIDLSNCKYIVNTSATKIGETSTTWDSATVIAENPYIFNITQSSVMTCYVHVLSVDYSGNKIETVSSSVRFRGSATLWSTKEWVPANSFWANNFSADGNMVSHVQGRSYIYSRSSYDLTACSTITFTSAGCFNDTYSKGQEYISFGVTKKPSSGSLVVEDKKILYTGKEFRGTKSFVIDVSSLTGNYYFMFDIYGPSGRRNWL